MKLFAQHNYARLGVSLFALDQNQQGERITAHRPIWSVVQEGTSVDPLVTIPTETAQMLMQQLWDLGFRPNNGAGSSAEADAQRRHINFAEQIARTLLRKS